MYWGVRKSGYFFLFFLIFLYPVLGARLQNVLGGPKFGICFFIFFYVFKCFFIFFYFFSCFPMFPHFFLFCFIC